MCPHPSTQKKQTFLFLGAGEAAIGIADLIAYAVARETGVAVEEARTKIWLFECVLFAVTKLKVWIVRCVSNVPRLEHPPTFI